MRSGELRAWFGAEGEEPFVVLEVFADGTTSILDQGDVYTFQHDDIESHSVEVISEAG